MSSNKNISANIGTQFVDYYCNDSSMRNVSTQNIQHGKWSWHTVYI